MHLSLLLATTILGSNSANADGESRATASDFLLATTGGEKFSLFDGGERLGTVLIFLAGDSERAGEEAVEVSALGDDYTPEGVRFAMVETSTRAGEEVRTWAEELELKVPVLLDPTRAVAERFDIAHTCEAVLLDAEHRVVYRGAISDGVEEHLALAIEMLLTDETPDSDRVEPSSPKLQAPAADSPFVAPTFHEQIATILDEHCVSCHRDGQIGPMPFTGYEDAHGWASMIAEVVDDGYMPPWHADSRFGTYANARRLTETEKELLRRWAVSGAEEGDPTNAPEPPSFPSREWEIGEPDLVVQLPEEEHIPATGVVDYRWIEVDPQLEEDHWVSAVEVQPTNRAVTHHVLVLLIPPEKSLRDVFRDQDFILSSGHFAVNVPGMGPSVFPDGYGIELKAGTRFLFQLHYTPNGVAAVDQTRMAIRWADRVIEHPIKTRAVLNTRLNIPPHAKDATFTADHEFRGGVKLLGLFPHMHSRGASFRIDLETVAGRETILNVPRYDFNWQHTYYFDEPLELAPGTHMHLTATYDNSEDNPRNPDPDERVYWGDQTWEEMLVGYVTYIDAE